MSSSNKHTEDPNGMKGGEIDLDVEEGTREQDAAEDDAEDSWPLPVAVPSSNNNNPFNDTTGPDFKDQVRTVKPPPPQQQGSIKHKQDPAVPSKVGHCPPPAPIDGGPSFKDQVRQQQQRRKVGPLQQEGEGIRNGPRFKDQSATTQNVPTDRQSSPDQDPASLEAEYLEAEAGQEMQTGEPPLPLTAQVVDDRELEEQIRRRILGEAAAAQAVPPSQVQPLLPCYALTCKKAMLYVVASLILVGIVLGVALPLALREGPTPSTGGVNEPSVPPNSPSTEAPNDIGFLSESTKLIASDGSPGNFGSAGDQFGISVAITGDTIVVGASLDDDNGTDSGSAYVFTHTGTTWTQQAKLTASDGAAGDYFGRRVAIAGDTIVVGARYDDDNGTWSGSAYVFMRTGTTWIEQAKLTASDLLPMIILESVWPLRVTPLWWVPMGMMTMATTVDQLMFSCAQEPLGPIKPS